MNSISLMISAVLAVLFLFIMVMILSTNTTPALNSVLSFGDCGKSEGMCVSSNMVVDYALPASCPNSYFKKLGSEFRKQTQCGVVNSCGDVSDVGKPRLNFNGNTNLCVGYSKTCTKAEGCCCVLENDCKDKSNEVCSKIKEKK